MRRLRNRLLLLMLLLSLTCFKAGWRCQAQSLVAEEVDALKLINAKMRVGWDFSVDPCSESKEWVDPTSNEDVARNVTCDRDLNNVYHVTSIYLKSQNLNGVLPAEFANLTSLKYLDLTRNYLNGSIPSAWARLPIVTLSLLGNRISGRIPEELGNMTTLESLLLSANNLSGELPESLGNLMNMEDFRIDGNPFSGKIPSFIGNWVKLNELDIQGTSLEGPFPPSFVNLTNITDLDLSFNNLSGEIPDQYSALVISMKYMDLSFNNFNRSNTPSNCQIGNVNFVGSYSSTKNYSIQDCLSEDDSCLGEKKNFNFSINCGGKMVTIGDLVYEEDSTPKGSSYFTISKSKKWAYSSTGLFWRAKSQAFTTVNATRLNMTDVGLYTTARLSPLSLRYYGLCLQKGNYTISLHFAEIMFIDDETYFSVGKRLFDVSIQGEKVLEDFDIVKKANGTGKKIVMYFTKTVDDDGTLEIHFQWMGKGTNATYRGVYGPLISAISVTSNFIPKVDFTVHKGGNELSVGAIIGIAGVLSDGSLIAVKQLSSKSKQGNREFVNEIGMISALNHPNLVKLFGCCTEGNQLLVSYEYMENNSLAQALFGPEVNRLSLDWPTRKRICLDIARGMAYLHEESRIRIVHRDIKATNILLDKDLNAKMSDFGLAKLIEEENTHISTRIAGTAGYMAPEYAMRGYLTDKAHVYSFGVVMLEIVSGKSNTNFKPKGESVYLLDWAYVLQERGNLLELVDPNLGTNYSPDEALQMLELTVSCANPSPTLRPTMSTVMSILDGITHGQMQPLTFITSSTRDIRFISSERRHKESETPTISTDGPWSISSISLPMSKAEVSHSAIETPHPFEKSLETLLRTPWISFRRGFFQRITIPSKE
ncbi:hypothetical protein HPP92_022984 [Vanilla planifolia]|uniref:non-specific serine/threonine protein kinase n=1 Tax=Vanilla planifolia TaxID=51239 RepID=A0A835PXK6_VANPL|nr:hypothetical protein HPP92_022984 [Vanilla planifolia]